LILLELDFVFQADKFPVFQRKFKERYYLSII
jgi:hypothetical protein